MAVTASFERGTLAATVAPADPASANPWDAVTVGANTTVKYDNSQAHYGGLSAKVVSAAAGGAYTSFMTWNTTTLGTAVTDHYGRLYIYPTVNLNGDRIIRCFGATGASAAHVSVFTDNTIQLKDSTLTVRAAGAVALVNNQWNRVEWHIVHSLTVGQIEARIFVGKNADGLIPDETLSSTAAWNTAAALNQLDFGLGDNDASMSFYLDDILALGTTWPGPSQGPQAVRFQPIPFVAPGRI